MRSKFRGVTYHIRRGQSYWRAKITVDKVVYYIGDFRDEKEAAFAYDEKAIELLCDKATLKFHSTPPNPACTGLRPLAHR